MISRNSVAYGLLITALVVTAVFSMLLFHRQRIDHDYLDVRGFPSTLGDWQGEDLSVSEYDYDILETRNLIFRKYVNSRTDKLIYLFVIYSETNRSVFHPPEVCFVGSGVTVTDKDEDTVMMGKRQFETNRLFLQKGSDEEIALYTYKAGDVYTESYYLQQLLFSIQQLFGRTRGGATIRVSMARTDDDAATTATLKEFMVRVVRELEGMGIQRKP